MKDHMVETYESRLKDLEQRNQRLQTENQQVIRLLLPKIIFSYRLL